MIDGLEIEDTKRNSVRMFAEIGEVQGDYPHFKKASDVMKNFAGAS